MLKSKRRALRGALNCFANDIKQVTQQLNDGVSCLQRALQRKACIGPAEFREVLSDIQEELSDLTAQSENLERYTFDTISFEELLGHGLVLYQANRKTMNHLEEHLQEYGYRQPPGVVAEPENPLSAEGVAAAKARRGDDACVRKDSSSSDDEAYEDADYRCPTDIRGAPFSSRKPFAMAVPPTGGMAPMSFLNKHRRRGTPVAKDHLPSDNEDEGCGGGQEISDEEGYARLDQRAAVRQQPGLAADVGFGGALIGHALAVAAPTGKERILSTMKAACSAAALTAAASIHASARKIPISRATAMAAKRDSLTPEPAYSHNTLKMLARYNPPANEEDESRVSISLAASFDKAGLPEAGADASLAVVQAEEISAAMRGLVLRGQRDGAVSMAVAAGSADWALSGGSSNFSDQVRAAAAIHKAAPVDEDTYALRHHLIRSKLDHPQPSALQQQAVRTSVSTLDVAGPSAVGAPPHGPGSQRLPPPAPSPPGGSTPEHERPPTTPGASRSVTPLSVLRADRERHNKVLEEKMAGLERVWVESGQAGRTPSDMRRSMGGGGLAAFIRAKSPGPSRAAAEAAASAAEPSTVTAASGRVAWGPERQHSAEAPDPRLYGQREADARSIGRVLSPLQTSSPFSGSAAATGNATSHRVARGSGLPVPPHAGAAACATSATAASATAAAAFAATASPTTAAAPSAVTTVVGATTLPRRDSTSNDASLRGAAAAKPTPRGTPGRTGRRMGTPGRVARAYSSPPAAATTPFERATEATTPRGAVRKALSPVGASGFCGGAGAADARASKLTPRRRSYAAAPLEAAAVAAAAAAATAAIEQSTVATPSRARRITMPATTAAATTAAGAASAAPAGMSGLPGLGRTRSVADEAGAQGFGFGAATRTTTAVAAALAPPGLSQLRLDGVGRGGAAWGGFPLSHRDIDGSSRVIDRPTTARTANPIDEVTLGMPPTVSQPGTPTTMTPGGSRQACGGLGATNTSAVGGLSPSGAGLTSHPLGDFFGGPARPVSRIPTPGKRAAAPSRLPTAAFAGSSASSSGGLEPCSEEEWRNLPATVQMAFPLEVLNGHIRTLGQTLAARPPSTDAARGKLFSAADMEALSLGSATAKRLLNALVKLGRCQVEGGGIGGGTMMYRLTF